MLPPFIIDQIRRLEEERQKQDRDQPRLELPLEHHRPSPKRGPSHSPDEGDNDSGDRGVVIVDL